MFYFRNKKLTLNIDFVSERVSEDIYLAMFRPESSDSTTSYTLGINLAGGIGSNSNGLNNNFQASLSFSKSVTYDTVSLTVHSSSEQKYNGYYNSVFFQYDFLNYADGAMVSPNIGLVSERMVAVYAVENYDETERFTIDITSTAYIFKDAHWPASNYTYEDVILHTYTV